MRAILMPMLILVAVFSPAVTAAAQSEFFADQSRLLQAAEARLAVDPADADALIWKGRRLGYLGRYEEAIETFIRGETLHPDDARFARHLGHRFISLRRFEDAEGALERAARLTAAMPDAVEPDGLPNPAGIPTSTLKGNIWYHLGLARYLQADFAGAARGFEGAAALAHNPDAATAARYWLYLSLMRAGDTLSADKVIAAIDPGWSLIENAAYKELALCLRGAADCEETLARAMAAEGVDYSTRAYGVAMARLLAGDPAGAAALLGEIVARGESAAFGLIAAEVDLARIGRGGGRE